MFLDLLILVGTYHLSFFYFSLSEAYFPGWTAASQAPSRGFLKSESSSGSWHPPGTLQLKPGLWGLIRTSSSLLRKCVLKLLCLFLVSLNRTLSAPCTVPVKHDGAVCQRGVGDGCLRPSRTGNWLRGCEQWESRADSISCLHGVLLQPHWCCMLTVFTHACSPT